MTRLDAEARLLLARDRTDRYRAEAAAERVAAGTRRGRGRGAVDGWEGRPAKASPSDRVLALAGRLRLTRGDRSPVPR